MDEFSFIQSITPKWYHQSSLLKGIGDDAAVFKSLSGQNIVQAVDTMVEEVHFSKRTMSPSDIGYRSLAANISDLAAMGSIPAYFLVSIVIPDHWEENELQELYMGMKELADLYQMDLIGGDTVSGKQLVLTITVIGFVPEGFQRYRSSAQPGDVVFVTGTLGDSAYGLHILTNETNDEINEKKYFLKRHRRPTPRIAFSHITKDIKRMALNDISDGISSESHELAEASNVDIWLEEANLPIHPELRAAPLSNEMKAKFILHGGEDFELIGTASPHDWEKIKKLADQERIPVSKIGIVKVKQKTEPQVWLNTNDHWRLLNRQGYTHAKRD
ncbi:thiamine-phosphate kinase [Bacillaceae bacterium S4-13-58]